MLHSLSCIAAIIAMTGVGALTTEAQQAEPVSPLRPLALPGTSFERVIGAGAIDPHTGLPRRSLLTAVAVWLSSEFDLPPINHPPSVTLVPVEEMIALRQRNISPDRSASRADMISMGPHDVHPDTVAIYSDMEGTIYLPETWSGTTPAELSILVHEMVHHIQNAAGLKYECPEAREKLAFAAQEQWLALFGRNLMMDFEIDRFTVLVRTTCFY